MGNTGMRLREGALPFAIFACVLLCTVTETTSTLGADCPAKAKAATAQCQGKVAKARAAAKQACGGRDPDAVIQKLAHLKKLASRQEAELKRSEKVLREHRSTASRLAKASGAERAKLLASLAKQKSGKKGLRKAQHNAAAEARSWHSLRVQADKATEDAVSVAKKTGDKARVGTAKNKAHVLWRKMVDEKVRIASTHRKVVAARTALAKLSAEVEKEIGIAKKTAQKEAGALTSVAQTRESIAIHKQQEAQAQYSAMQTKAGSAESQQHMLWSSMQSARHDIATNKKTLKNAKKIEGTATKAARAAAHAKASAGGLDMRKLKKEAKSIAAGHAAMPAGHQGHSLFHKAESSVRHALRHASHTAAHHGSHVASHHSSSVGHTTHTSHTTSHSASHHSSPHGDPHKEYAKKVKYLEKQRLSAKAAYHQKQVNLARVMKRSSTPPALIAKLQQEVHAAKSNEKKISAAEHRAVMGAVGAVNAAVGHANDMGRKHKGA